MKHNLWWTVNKYFAFYALEYISDIWLSQSITLINRYKPNWTKWTIFELRKSFQARQSALRMICMHAQLMPIHWTPLKLLSKSVTHSFRKGSHVKVTEDSTIIITIVRKQDILQNSQSRKQDGVPDRTVLWWFSCTHTRTSIYMHLFHLLTSLLEILPFQIEPLEGAGS